MLMAIGLGILVWCALSVVLSLGVGRYLARGATPVRPVALAPAPALAGSRSR